ncbi:MAG: hypothetical protein K8S97_04555 [Anaerolineae bacterium]|nr:hypothetical protein [Anaerolineae bacterium]
MARFLKVALVIMVTLVLVLPVQAQDGGELTEEQVLALERVVAAMNAVETYDFMVVDTEEMSYNTMDVTQGERTLTVEEMVFVEKSVRHIQGDVANRHGMFRVDVTATELDGTSYALTLLAEGRLVDDVLYLQTEQEVTEGSTDPVPEGWVVVETEDDFPALGHLSLDNFLEDPDDPNIFDHLDVLFESTSDVIVESIVLEDGTPVDVITIVFEAEELLGALQKFSVAALAPGDVQAVMYEAIDLQSTLLIQVALTADDVVVARAGEATFVWVDLDMSLINPEIPPGAATLSMTSQFGIESVISDVGVPLEPIAAPEM